MTRRRHFPNTLKRVARSPISDWALDQETAQRLHCDGLTLPTPWRPNATWQELDQFDEALGEAQTIVDFITGLRRKRIGAFLEVGMPRGWDWSHEAGRMALRNTMNGWLDWGLTGVLVRDAWAWPKGVLIELERKIRTQMGAVLIGEMCRSAEGELLDGLVDAAVDPTAVTGVDHWLAGRLSGAALIAQLTDQQDRLGIELAGRMIHPLLRLEAEGQQLGLAYALIFCLRGCPVLPAGAPRLAEYELGRLAQLRRQSAVLEWGWMTNLTPPTETDVIAFARVDEQGEPPVVVVARRCPGESIVLPLRVDRHTPDEPWVDLIDGAVSCAAKNGWLHVPASTKAHVWMLGQQH
jgi:hypothetical protein